MPITLHPPPAASSITVVCYQRQHADPHDMTNQLTDLPQTLPVSADSFLCVSLCIAPRYFIINVDSCNHRRKLDTTKITTTTKTPTLLPFPSPPPSPPLTATNLTATNLLSTNAILSFQECCVSWTTQPATFEMGFPPAAAPPLYPSSWWWTVRSHVLLSSAPVHGCPKICPAVYLLKDIWAVSSLGCYTESSIDISVQALVWMEAFTSLG